MKHTGNQISLKNLQLTAAVILGLSLTACASYMEPQGATTRVNDDGLEEICINLKLTGTNVAKRYCRTESEWERMAENDQQVASEFFRQTNQRSGIIEQSTDAGPF